MLKKTQLFSLFPWRKIKGTNRIEHRFKKEQIQSTHEHCTILKLNIVI